MAVGYWWSGGWVVGVVVVGEWVSGRWVMGGQCLGCAVAGEIFDMRGFADEGGLGNYPAHF